MLGLDNPLHILFLLVVLLLLFGAKRLPEMGKGLGSGLRGFREALSGEASSPALSAITSSDELAAEQPEGQPTTGASA
jgi:sec-independent protein translocase protein TatA